MLAPMSWTLVGECSFIHRYMLRESCSQFDSLPLTYLTIAAPMSWTPRPARLWTRDGQQWWRRCQGLGRTASSLSAVAARSASVSRSATRTARKRIGRTRCGSAHHLTARHGGLRAELRRAPCRMTRTLTAALSETSNHDGDEQNKRESGEYNWCALTTYSVRVATSYVSTVVCTAGSGVALARSIAAPPPPGAALTGEDAVE